jgi:DNA-binding winged helix-turn-helix (wHTH) protein/tetratricopeptide (TPR) repeat protein
MNDTGTVNEYSFGNFRLDARRRHLCDAAGAPCALTTKVFDTLLYLVEHADEVVTKRALMAAVWPGAVVEENSLSQCISALRRVLGEGPGDNHFIVTVPGRGYRFVARVATRRDPPANTGVDDVAERVAAAVLRRLSSGELRSLRRRPTENTEAFQLYVTGWSALTRPAAASLAHALQCLERAVALDPKFALAQVCIAGCHALTGVFGMRAPHSVFPQARAAVLRALELDPDLAEVHAALGHIHTVYDLDWARARGAYERALAIDPGCAMAHHYSGLQFLVHGDFDTALEHVRRAQALEPLAFNYNANIGLIHYYAGRYADAIAQLEATLQMDASLDHARTFLGRALMRSGDHGRAIAEFARRTTPTIGAAADLPVALALSGRHSEAQARLEELLRTAEGEYVSPHNIATIHAALGATELALDWLERAVEQRAQPINYLRLDPAFSALHSQPRFQALLTRLAV